MYQSNYGIRSNDTNEALDRLIYQTGALVRILSEIASSMNGKEYNVEEDTRTGIVNAWCIPGTDRGLPTIADSLCSIVYELGNITGDDSIAYPDCSVPDWDFRKCYDCTDKEMCVRLDEHIERANAPTKQF